MKKLLIVSLVLLLAVSAFAEIKFYSQLTNGLWYELQDEDTVGNEKAKVDLDFRLYSSSRLGMDYIYENMNAKMEFGLGESGVSLRHLYAEFPLGDFKILIGQSFTGFKDFSSQASIVNGASEDLSAGYGAAYDGRKNQIRLTHKSGFYGMLLKPTKIDPLGSSDDLQIDALIPKINLGYKTLAQDISIHPSFGFAMSQYNEDFSGNDDLMIAYVAAFTICYKQDGYYFRGNLNVGQNMKDYGIIGKQIAGAYTNVDSTGTILEILDATTVGGYGEFGYNLDSKKMLVAGIGYVSSNRDDFEQEDNAMTAFAQLKYKLNNYVTIMPGVGIVDNLENSNGEDEGSIFYVGSKFQINFDYTVK